MLSTDRRTGSRLPLEMFLNAYVKDRQQRGFTMNLSPSGLYLNLLKNEPLPVGTTVGLEFTLPGVTETIWAAGETCYGKTVDAYFLGQGIRFTGIAGLHARIIEDFCKELRRRRWGRPLPRA
jgi:hypothetical protein